MPLLGVALVALAVGKMPVTVQQNAATRVCFISRRGYTLVKHSQAIRGSYTGAVNGSQGGKNKKS